MRQLVFILLFLDYSLCLDMSILRHLYIRIRESIFLSSYFSRVIRQSPYQSRVLAITSRCVYRPSVVQLFVWVFMCVYLVAFYLSLHCSRVSLRAHPLSLPQYFIRRWLRYIGVAIRLYVIIIILPIEKHMQSKTMVLYPPCYQFL